MRSSLNEIVESKLLYFAIDFLPYSNDLIHPTFYAVLSDFIRDICVKRKVDLSALRMDLIIYEIMSVDYEREYNDFSMLIDGTYLRMERLTPDMHNLLEAIYDSSGLHSLEISYLDRDFDSDFLALFDHLTEIIINIDEIVFDENAEDKLIDELGKLLNHDPYITTYSFVTKEPDVTRITNFMARVLEYLNDAYPGIVYPHVTNFGGPVFLSDVSLLAELFPSIDQIIVYSEEPIPPQRIAELERETHRKRLFQYELEKSLNQID